MAYAHGVYEVRMSPNYSATGIAGATPTGGVNFAITGLMGRWTCGFVPHAIIGAAVVRHVTTFAGAAGKFGFEADISVAGTATRLFSMSVPTAGVAHKSIYYRPTYYIEIKPGSWVDFRVTAADVGSGEVMLLVQPRWEEPTNVTGMYQTT
jgi:hypothetical protein